MPHTFATQEWADALWAALRTDERVRSAAAAWVHGPILLQIEAQPDKEFEQSVSLLLSLHEGEAREFRVLTDDTQLAPFALAAPYERWKQIFRGQLDMVSALTDGKLQLTGDLTHLVRSRDLLAALASCAAALDVTYPDEVPAAPVNA
jgi:putative sterol carrier protein